MTSLSIQLKMSILVFILILTVGLAGVLSIHEMNSQKNNSLLQLETSIRQSFDSNIKQQVENACSMLQSIFNKTKSGEYTLSQAKVIGADFLRELKYGTDGYFWADTYDGTNVVLLGTESEGKNRLHATDAAGFKMVEAAIDAGRKPEGGYVDYQFPKPNETSPSPKRAYTKAFEPFQWVIGTGNYTDFVESYVEEQKAIVERDISKSIQKMIVIVVGCVIISVLLSVYIAASIVLPLRRFIYFTDQLVKGNYHLGINAVSKDEIGQLAKSLQALVLKLEAELNEERNLFKTTLHSLGDAVISTNKDGNVSLMNAVAEDLTGWTNIEAKDMPFETVFQIVHEYTGEKCPNPVKQVFETGEIIELANHTMLIKKNGDAIAIEDSAAPIKDEYGNINGVVLVFRDFTDKKEKQEKIRYLSNHDQLTGLYNRHYFEEQRQLLDIEESLPFTIVMADVNGLKLTNDAFGHKSGDALLKRVANMIKKECRADDIMARVGGDEFVLLLPKTTSMEAECIVNRINASIENEKQDSIVASVSFGWDTKETFDQIIDEVFTRAEEHMYRKKLVESQSMRNHTIKVIMQTLLETNMRERIHSEKVSQLSRSIGESMHLDSNALKELETAALMHDIGKIAINENLLNKEGHLTEVEYEEIKRHPEIGYHILKSVDAYTNLADYVLSHHERWDGTGYPRGLSGQEIPLVARIIAVADSFEAMIGERTYRDSMNPTAASVEIKRCSETQFDPDIVNAFCAMQVKPLL